MINLGTVSNGPCFNPIATTKLLCSILSFPELTLLACKMICVYSVGIHTIRPTKHLFLKHFKKARYHVCKSILNKTLFL